MSFKIGATSVGIPIVADDNCMIADTHTGTQTQLLMAQDNAARVRYIFSETKSKVMHFCPKGSLSMPLLFNNKEIEYSRRETHLGLVRTDDGKASVAVSERIKTGRRTALSLMGAGLYGVNGVSPHVSKTLIATYVDPAVYYGLEAMTLSEADYQELDKSQRTLLHEIQGLPDSTAIPAVYLLLGVLPMSAQVHIKILSVYNSIIHRPKTEFDIIMRQLAIKDSSSHSWTSELRRVLYTYQLPSPMQLAHNPPEKERWKQMVKAAVWAHWENKLKDQAAVMKSLRYLNINMCAIGYTHPVWVIMWR